MMKYFTWIIGLCILAIAFTGWMPVEVYAQDNPVNTSDENQNSDKNETSSSDSKSTSKQSNSKSKSASSSKKSSSSGKKSSSSGKKSSSSGKKSSSSGKKSSSSGKKSSSSGKKSSSSSKKSSSSSKKSSSSSKKNKKADRDNAPILVEYSKAEIEKYRAMPYQTWESPSGLSELGLPIQEGFVQPYPYGNLMRQYDGNKCRHRGLDIGTFGKKNYGIGTVINAMTHSVITLIGKTGENVGEFGKQDTRSGMAHRSGHNYPRQILVPGYGLVYPFSRNYGRWRSGTVIVTRVLDGPFKNYIIRYMHLAAVRPDLHVGSELQAGEHIALMGATAVMDSPPHVHIDMETPDKKRVDPGPYIGLRGTGVNCGLPEPEVNPGNTATSSHASKVRGSGVQNSIIRTTSTAQGKNTRVDSKSTNAVVHKRRPNYVSELPSADEPVYRVLDRNTDN